MIAKEIRQQVYHKYNGHCAYCGEKIAYKDMQVDHIQAKHRGGKDCIENYNPACRSCNHRKDTFDIETFRSEIKKTHERLLRDNITYRIANRFGFLGKLKEEIVFYFETL